MLAKKYRLNRNDEILRVLKEGKWVKGEMMGVKYVKKYQISNIKYQKDKLNIKNEQENSQVNRLINLKENVEVDPQILNQVQDDITRFAVVVSRKVFRRAVDRNRAKRLVREAVRLLLSGIKDGYEVVLLIQSGIVDKKMQGVKEEVERLFRRVNLIKDDTDTS